MKILVVDDSRTGRNYLSKTLVMGNVQEENIIQAANGQEALEIVLNSENIGIIFLDVNMPVMSGIDFLFELKEKRELSEYKIVITSSLVDTARVDALKELGVSFFVKKPFTPEQLNQVYELIK